MSDTYVLLQYGADACNIWFQDLEEPQRSLCLPCPNLIVKLSRELSGRSITRRNGPDAAFFYFVLSFITLIDIRRGTPTPTPGFIIYGTIATRSDGYLQRQNRKGSQCVTYFTTQSGRDYKWKIMPQRMELVNSRSTLAVWELSTPTDGFYARLTIRQAGLAIITELMATLTINLMSENFGCFFAEVLRRFLDFVPAQGMPGTDLPAGHSEKVFFLKDKEYILLGLCQSPDLTTVLTYEELKEAKIH
ncbi:hypothetical protein B0H13DRAFT_1884516 [Mycena leptocephala]|nr:hypothetical protein B0H13DRAFT_1884516 [Mycena leptocephala]